MKICIFGAGRVGSAIVRDLAEEPDVKLTVIDTSDAALARVADVKNVHPVRADASDTSTLRKYCPQQDLVVSVVPGDLGYSVLEAAVELSPRIVDVSFMPEDPFRLHSRACQRGIPVIVDCGFSPGLGNILLGHAIELFDQVTSYECYVGGLPVLRRRPYEYAAVFSPVDVLEEYTRPSRYMEDEKIVVKPALSDVELIDFEGIGTLEAFNTDGLRTLLHTFPIKNMKEKTLRYPGHAALMAIFRDTGFFGKDPMSIGGAEIRPIDVTGRLLFPHWQLQPGEKDISVLRVDVRGTIGAESRLCRYELLDSFDVSRNITSMARTTGYTCTAAARLLLKNAVERVGIIAPEILGTIPAAYHAILTDLRERNVVIREHRETSAK